MLFYWIFILIFVVKLKCRDYKGDGDCFPLHLIKRKKNKTEEGEKIRMSIDRNNEIEVKNEVERQFNILSRGCDEIINENEFKKKLEKSISTNTPLRVKLGIDPTGSELHLGHAVPLRKLKQFQDLGHEVLFLIGTFTGRIGDPTGKSETRKMLSEEQVNENIKTYLDQVKLILDLDKIKVVYNADWLEKLSLSDALNLLSQFTVSQMISREDFSKRLSENKPVSLIEFMYPILQGYDSV